MEQTIQFFVDDTSPTVAYSPISDTFSTPNLTASWNPYYSKSGFARSIGDTGDGDSYHVTSMNGALLSISWIGTGVRLLGYTNGSNYEVLLDGAIQTTLGDDLNDKILANFQNLTNTAHNITLRTKLPASTNLALPSLFFDRALVTAEAAAAQNTQVTSHNLSEQSIFYSGQWSSQTVSGRSVHISKNLGDSTTTAFNGSSFMLTGMTSPESGNYTVTLDNQTMSFSGRSSFVRSDTVLFFATGLDSNKTHELRITNTDGSNLSLNADGFMVYAAEPPTVSPASTPLPSSALDTTGNSISKGTIAALVLGGILAFLGLTGLLFFCFIIRPRRRRARQDMDPRPQHLSEPKETREVLNISHPPTGRGGVYTYDSNVGYVRDYESTIQNDPGANPVSANRTSGTSGFAKWKRDLELGIEGLGLSIRFRHSDSTGGRTHWRSASSNIESPGGVEESMKSPGGQSSRFGSGRGSWSRMSRKGKKKAKGSPNVSAGSWSPGVALELPVRPSSHTSFDESKDKSPSDSKPPSITSGLDSLSYAMHSQATAGPTMSHAYAFTHENSRRSSQGQGRRPLGPRQSLPRTFTSTHTNFDSIAGHSRQESAGTLLALGGEPNVITEDEMSPQSHDYQPLIGTIIPPTPQEHGRVQQEDRGSAGYTPEESVSYLEPSTTRHAIRGLSPRTSHIDPVEAVPSSSTNPATRQSRPNTQTSAVPGPSRNKPSDDTLKAQGPSRTAEQKRPNTALTHDSSQAGDSFLEVGSPENRTLEMRAEEGASVLSSSPPQIRSSFLEIRPPSPLHVDLLRAAGLGSTPDRNSPAGSSPQAEKRATMLSTSTGTTDEKNPREPHALLRLTPDLRSSAHGHPTRDRNGSISFLDFSSSSDTSSKTRSIAPSEFSTRFAGSISAQLQQQYPLSSFPPEIRRQSTALSHSTEQTQSSFISGPSSSPPSNRDSFFPYPVTFAPSSPFYNPSMQQMQSNPPLPESSHQATPRPPPLSPIVVPPPQTGNVRVSTGSDISHQHPTSIVISPTDSVPMSVSELRFRHSDSTSGSLSARLPPHPPLPGSARSRTEFEPAPLSPPSYIVQQVLGRSPDPNRQDTPGSANTPSFPTSRTARPG